MRSLRTPGVSRFDRQLPGGAGLEIGNSDGQAGSPAAQPFPRPRRPWWIGTRLRIGHYLPPGGNWMTTSQTGTNLAWAGDRTGTMTSGAPPAPGREPVFSRKTGPTRGGQTRHQEFGVERTRISPESRTYRDHNRTSIPERPPRGTRLRQSRSTATGADGRDEEPPIVLERNGRHP
jgi:hypothetical protein